MPSMVAKRRRGPSKEGSFICLFAGYIQGIAENVRPVDCNVVISVNFVIFVAFLEYI